MKDKICVVFFHGPKWHSVGSFELMSPGGNVRDLARVLLVEDNPSDVLLFENHLQELPGHIFQWELTSCISLQSALRLLDTETFDIVVLDLGLPDSQGQETFTNFFNRHPRVPVIVLTGCDDEQLAVDLLKSGAQDYLPKCRLNADLLGRALVYAIERNHFTWELADLQKQREEDRRQLSEIQKRLVHAEKMESLGRMAAGVAHEVKNPLATLQMGVDFMSGKTDPDNESDTVILQDMRDSINRANGIMRDMVQYSRSRELEATDGHIHDTIEKALELLKHDIRNSAANIEHRLAADVPRSRFDQAKILQVTINLLTNALYVVKPGGCITLRTGCADRDELDCFTSAEERRFLVVEIMDDGPGLPADKLDSLFEPFFTTKPPGEGTGLGLSVCRTIAELHDGDLQLFNNPDRGATARLLLPL